MSDRILVGTRKGTFLITRTGSRWQPQIAGHAGRGVNFSQSVLWDPGWPRIPEFRAFHVGMQFWRVFFCVLLVDSARVPQRTLAIAFRRVFSYKCLIVA